MPHDFKAAIEAEKARLKAARNRTPTSVESISSTPAPALTNGPGVTAKTDVPEAVMVKRERVSPPTQSTDSSTSRDAEMQEATAPPQPTTSTNMYAGLTSARKRRAAGDSNTIDRPHAPPKRTNRGPRAPILHTEPVDTRGTVHTSDWYRSINMSQKFSRGDIITLQRVNQLIQNCRKALGTPELEQQFGEIRNVLHKMDTFDFLTGVIIKKSKVLEEETGLPLIFLDPLKIGFPWDVKADSRALFSRWMQGDLDPHLLRGIDTRKNTSARGTSISHRLSTEGGQRKSCNVVGANGLENGQWWPMQICALRDGAHGEIEGGIHGRPDRGALSVILSSGGYEDRDEGENVLYCGTSGTKEKPTASTLLMLEAYRRKTPVRLLRSAALPKTNIYRPEKGLRYDGLYDVVAVEVLHEDSAMHRFALKRQNGQDPIRAQGAQRRPTNEEVDAYMKVRDLLGLTQNRTE
ncbi:MAG: 60S ribosomal protein L20 [Chaenotheca gracillima]|nr:MAG: 60S ribosomal protein L20 [Chaenotheca gracillima]